MSVACGTVLQKGYFTAERLPLTAQCSDSLHSKEHCLSHFKECDVCDSILLSEQYIAE